MPNSSNAVVADEGVEVIPEIISMSPSEMAVVKQSQSLMQTAYDEQVLVNAIAQQISVPPKGDIKVASADVLHMVRLASSMHLDPMLGGLWAYKDKNGRLVCGVSKKGWQQALASQPDCVGVTFQHGEIEIKKIPTTGGVMTLECPKWSKCIIKKMKCGMICEFEGIAYAKEEIDPSKPTWCQRPQRMLDNRALTIAAGNAYGWGAYEKDEVDAVAKADGATVVGSVTKDLLMQEMRTALNVDELRDLFRTAPEDLKKDPDVIELGKSLTEKFKV